jgi:dolichyl-phosphate beta-glucosyltransferase
MLPQFLDHTTLLSVLVALIVTVGLPWIFSPALLAAWSDSLQWDETELSATEEPILLSLIIPAYNEEDRIPIMMQDAHKYLTSSQGATLLKRLQVCATLAGYTLADRIEWIVVDDGSSDGTCRVVRLEHERLQQPTNNSNKKNAAWKLVSLHSNSGKGAAVKTGMLLANGHFRLMVDADGATDFGPGLELLIEQLLTTLEENSKNKNKAPKSAIAVFGSRAHLQSEGAVQRSLVRTILMYGFHFFVSLLVSSEIKDTQCGFKLFTQEAAREAFSRLHLRRWAFDTELLVLCSYQNTKVLEVGVPWQEVDGSKLHTSKFALAMVSLSMLRDMICVRACYSLHIWKASR